MAETRLGPRLSGLRATPHLDVHDLRDLPEVNEEPNEDADLHHKVGLVVEDVEEDHERLEHTEEHRADGQPLQRLPAVPELDVWRGRGQRKARAAAPVSPSPWDRNLQPRGRLTVLESEEFKDAVHNGDDDGQRQEVRIGFQQSNLGGGRKERERSLRRLVGHGEVQEAGVDGPVA